MSTDEMQEVFASEQEQLRLAQLGLGRLFKIIEKGTSLCLPYLVFMLPEIILQKETKTTTF